MVLERITLTIIKNNNNNNIIIIIIIAHPFLEAYGRIQQVKENKRYKKTEYLGQYSQPHLKVISVTLER